MTDLDINLVLKELREMVGNQAQEIAILKATISSLQKVQSENESK